VEKRKKNTPAAAGCGGDGGGVGGAGAYPLPSMNKACCPEKEECGPGKGLLWRRGRRIMLLLVVLMVMMVEVVLLVLIPFRP
jgi:hypothetical protein